MRKPVFTDFLDKPGQVTPTTREPIRSGPVQGPQKPTVADKIAPKLTAQERAKADSQRASAKAKKSLKTVVIGKDSYDYEFTGWDTMSPKQKADALKSARADIIANDPTADKKATNRYDAGEPVKYAGDIATDLNTAKGMFNDALGYVPQIQAINAYSKTPIGEAQTNLLRAGAKKVTASIPDAPIVNGYPAYDKEGLQMVSDLTVNAPAQTINAVADFYDKKTDNIGRLTSSGQVALTAMGAQQALKAGKTAFDIARKTEGFGKAAIKGVAQAFGENLGIDATPVDPSAPVSFQQYRTAATTRNSYNDLVNDAVRNAKASGAVKSGANESNLRTAWASAAKKWTADNPGKTMDDFAAEMKSAFNSPDTPKPVDTPSSFSEFQQGAKGADDVSGIDYEDFYGTGNVSKTQQVPQPETMPKVETKAAKASAVESGGDLVGYAKQVSGNDPLPGVNREQLLKAGEDAIATGRVNPDAYIDDVLKTGGKSDPEGIAASLIEYRKIRNRQQELEKIATPESADEWTSLQARADKYSQAGDLIGNDWHKTGMALQIALKQDMSLGALKSRARMMNFGQEVSADTAKKLEDLNKQYESALSEIEKLKTNNAEVMGRIKTAAPGRLSVASREKARTVAADYFKGKQLEPTGGVGKNRQRGAVTYTITPEEIRAKSAVRKLAKEIALDGADNLKAVLDGIRKEIGVPVKDEQLLGMIYEPYTKYRIEADVARIKANQALSDVQRAAEFRAKSKTAKTWAVVEGVLNNLTRTMSLGADLSAPMIQGRKGITANSRGWVKAYDPMIRVAFARNTEKAALEHLAKIENANLYPKAKAAGLEITTPGGKFTQQEENFIGNMSRILEIAQNAKGATTPIKIIQPYLSTMVRSENAFTTYMNDLRWSTFERFAKVSPNDPQYLKDVAAYINVIYGRGTGKMAQAAGQLNLGRGLLAPRYLVSQLQFQSGVPFFAAKTGAAKRKIAIEYAKYIGAVSGLMYLARVNGWDAPTDTRHTDFGKMSNGKVTIDVASKDVQFWKLMIQNLYGKVNQVGGYKEPNFYNSASVDAQFVQGKLAPLPKLGSELIFGQFTDQGKRVPVADIPGRDQALRIAPIWVQDLVKDSEKWDDKSKQALFTVLGILGQDNKPRPIKDGGQPIDYKRPGIYSGG